MKTQSEKWFESFCDKKEIKYSRIEEGKNRTPDYNLIIDGTNIIVEVKEFSRNKQEKESDKQLEELGYGRALSNIPGDRVRKKITSASPQIKSRTKGKNPSILVLCDILYGCGQVVGHTDSYNIRVGMYGLEQVHIAMPNNYSDDLQVKGMSYGPKKKMTEKQNTSISAIGVLSTTEEKNINLVIYHNKHAAVPLNYNIISKYGITQYTLKDEINNTGKWVKVSE